MKVEYWTCDECGKQLNGTSGDLDKDCCILGYHICKECRVRALEKVFNTKSPVYLKRVSCKQCKGTGKVKDYHGYNNDFDWIKCECTL